MRTTVTLADKLLEEVMRYTGARNRSEAIRIALKAYIRQQELQEIRAMRGTMEFDDDLYEFRALDKASL